MAKTRNYATVTGWGSSGGAPVSKSKDAGYETLVVSVNSPSTDNAFWMHRHQCGGSVINGSGPGGYYAENWPTNFYDRVSYFPTFATPDIPSSRASILANTNPFRADVLVPTFVFELREIPSMIRFMGEILLKGPHRSIPRHPLSAAKQAAATNLAVQFGWLPIIGDLKAMAKFTESFKKRHNEFDRLNSGSGLKRRLTLNQAETSTSFTFTSSGVARLKNGTESAHAVSKQITWGTVRWKPTPMGRNSPLLHPSNSSIAKDILGLSPKHITANLWNALPWSWLVDWFSNFGDLMDASLGSGLMLPHGINVMTHNTVDITHGAYEALIGGAVPATCSPGHIRAEAKHRVPANSGGFTTRFPLLSGSQLSILGSLATLRASVRR